MPAIERSLARQRAIAQQAAHSEGSPGGSNWTMAVTDGKSRPRAATSVLSSTPVSHLVKSRKVAVLTLCKDDSGWEGRQTARAFGSQWLTVRSCAVRGPPQGSITLLPTYNMCRASARCGPQAEHCS